MVIPPPNSGKDHMLLVIIRALRPRVWAPPDIFKLLFSDNTVATFAGSVP